MSGSLEQDPTVFADLIGRNVEIESKSGLLYHGKCLSVDPISGSLIIIKKDELLLLPWVEMVIFKSGYVSLDYFLISKIPFDHTLIVKNYLVCYSNSHDLGHFEH